MRTVFTSSRRGPATIGAGAMADIAFLLLIFFLVATVILDEKGILVRLPPFADVPPADIPARNVFSVKINGWNELLVEGQPAVAGELRRMVQEFVLNPQGHSDLAISPTKAVVSLQHDRGTNYNRYIEVYDHLAAAYREMWDAEAMKTYGKHYDQLADAQRKAVRRRLPMVISEAEPSAHMNE